MHEQRYVKNKYQKITLKKSPDLSAMPPNRSDRGDSGDWVPIAAGVVVGVGVLALIYKLFFSGCRGAKCTQINQQIGAPFTCTCNDKGAKCKLHAK